MQIIRAKRWLKNKRSLKNQGVAAARRRANFVRFDGIPTTCRVIPAWTRGVVARCRAVDASRRLENICPVEITDPPLVVPVAAGAKIKRHRSVIPAILAKEERVEFVNKKKTPFRKRNTL